MQIRVWIILAGFAFLSLLSPSAQAACDPIKSKIIQSRLRFLDSLCDASDGSASGSACYQRGIEAVLTSQQPPGIILSASARGTNYPLLTKGISLLKDPKGSAALKKCEERMAKSQDVEKEVSAAECFRKRYATLPRDPAPALKDQNALGLVFNVCQRDELCGKTGIRELLARTCTPALIVSLCRQHHAKGYCYDMAVNAATGKEFEQLKKSCNSRGLEERNLCFQLGVMGLVAKTGVAPNSAVVDSSAKPIQEEPTQTNHVTGAGTASPADVAR